MGLDPLDLIFRIEKRFDTEINQTEGAAVLLGTAVEFGEIRQENIRQGTRDSLLVERASE